ncbi:hypothetical protein [Armatimonas sp.]|uniref:hypothetical protein n=1 Tax=Armatimonas sp. TaxID=1872638 RepID=UPI0037528BA4
MNNPEAENEAAKRPVGKPPIPGLVQKAVHFDEKDLAAFTAHYKGRLLPDGTKDSVSAALRRLMHADLERIEKDALYAQKKARE